MVCKDQPTSGFPDDLGIVLIGWYSSIRRYVLQVLRVHGSRWNTRHPHHIGSLGIRRSIHRVGKHSYQLVLLSAHREGYVHQIAIIRFLLSRAHAQPSWRLQSAP